MRPWPTQDTVRPWDELGDDEKRLFSRMAEVFAGFLSYTDAQIGRILDYLEESGQLDNTIIVVISDNGASGEGGPNGSVNEVKFFNGYIDTVEDGLRLLDELGGPQTYNHYPTGWAMAFNAPYKLFKRYASHEGGIADPAIISWPKGISAHGEVRDSYINVCDVTPTIYRAPRDHPARGGQGSAAEAAGRGEFRSGVEGFVGDNRQALAVLHDARNPGDLARRLVRQHGARRVPGWLVAFRQRPLGVVPHRSRPQPMPRSGCRKPRQTRRTQNAVVRRGRQVQRVAARRPEHLRHDLPVAAEPGGPA
ncbi:sulfatase-like hydrolase/transferase [Mycolicibacterium novocastrense]|nr:sulfatase-like hydrolase/transferase [Mycolicibacterium novocastrense]